MTRLTRRSVLNSGAALGLTVSFMGRPALADPALADRKLVVIICRGAMDGLSVSPPVGDPDYAGLRGKIAIPGFGADGGALKMDSNFGLHPKLATVHRLAQDGQARIAPAIASTDRARSHFEAQDVLESGAVVVYSSSSGWLNRTLQAMGPARNVQALSVGAQAPLILRGPVQAASWSPGGLQGHDPRLPGILADLYAGDPLLGPALASGLRTESMARAAMAMTTPADAAEPKGLMQAAAQAPSPGAAIAKVADAARSSGAAVAKLMTAEDGPSLVAISLEGFDTHANQGASDGQLANRLGYLDAVIDGLHTGLGQAWSKTAVVVVTEFGRTARINGTSGTDHGTASTALVLGGSLRRGGIIGDWPGLAPGRLFEGRDTAPTLEMRSLFKGILAEQLGVDRQALDSVVFPGSAGAAPVTGLFA